MALPDRLLAVADPLGLPLWIVTASRNVGCWHDSDLLRHLLFGRFRGGAADISQRVPNTRDL
jgi:hypothetical protein